MWPGRIAKCEQALCVSVPDVHLCISKCVNLMEICFDELSPGLTSAQTALSLNK